VLFCIVFWVFLYEKLWKLIPPTSPSSCSWWSKTFATKWPRRYSARHVNASSMLALGTCYSRIMMGSPSLMCSREGEWDYFQCIMLKVRWSLAWKSSLLYSGTTHMQTRDQYCDTVRVYPEYGGVRISGASHWTFSRQGNTYLGFPAQYGHLHVALACSVSVLQFQRFGIARFYCMEKWKEELKPCKD
jgi:hypothetical protein